MKQLSIDASKKVIGGADFKKIYLWSSMTKECKGYNVTYDKHGNYDKIVYLGNYAPSYCSYHG